MKNTLPHQEPQPAALERRKSWLVGMQAKYQYAYEYADTIAVVRRVPWREFPGPVFWLRGGLHLAQLVPSLPGLLLTMFRYLAGKPLRDLRDFIFFSRSPQPNAGLVHTFQRDSEFGLQRVIGVNPVVLRGVSERQPLPKAIAGNVVQTLFESQIDDLPYAEALREKRLYVLDYAELAILQQHPGRIDRDYPQHITTPIVVLYQQADGVLRPFAIQLEQGEDLERRIYHGGDGNLWLAAKALAQMADGNHHILVTHATRIHYVMEAVILASRRQLYKTHPLAVLLQPHLKYTLNINHQHTFLKDRWGRPGRFGELFAGDYAATTQCMANGMRSYNFKAAAFPRDIADREVANPELYYPFRDDGLLLWDAVQAFTQDYVELYYASDADVVEDTEVQAWAYDISAEDRGRIPGFPAAFNSRGELAETLGQLVFHCTAFHSCIHFNQYSYPGFVPNMPYAAYRAPPTGDEADWDAARLWQLLPAFRAAYSQTWTYYLTDFRVNRIGQYPLRRFDAPAQQVIRQFRRRLTDIEKVIDERNNRRPQRYERMNPRTIPNGVTV